MPAAQFSVFQANSIITPSNMAAMLEEVVFVVLLRWCLGDSFRMGRMG